ncbi:MAG: JAB domain-containing protein [Methanoregula sp.]|nr:JAB domain-containing protein [Methanoregula sp.]
MKISRNAPAIIIAVILLIIYIMTYSAGAAPSTSGKPTLAETYQYLGAALEHAPTEHLYLIELDQGNEVTAVRLIAEGNQTRLNFDIMEVIAIAEQDHANRIILLHNHPGGNTTPSPDDIYWMSETARDCAASGILMVDAVITGKDRVVSIPREA